MQRLALPSLPVELLCHILSYLDAHQLAHARKICKVVKAAIDHSELLQYIIDLGFYNVVEAGPPQISIQSQAAVSVPVPVAMRRKELRELEASWQRLRYRGRCGFSLPVSGPIYDFMGGIYALAGEGGLRFAVLPHGHETQPVRTWNHNIDTISMIDLTFCPFQDLLVIVTMTADNHNHAYDVHLKTLATNQPHPHAALPVLQALKQSDTATDSFHAGGPVKLQVMGNYLALLCRDVVANDSYVGDYLQLWTWTDARGYEFILYFEDSVNDFSFLSEDRFLLLADDGTIELYSFTDKTRAPQCTAKLGMPKLMHDWQLAEAFLGSSPTPGIVGVAPPFMNPRTASSNHDDQTSARMSMPVFYPDADDQLLAFHVTVVRQTNEADTHPFVYFVRRSSLLRLEDTYVVHLAFSDVGASDTASSSDRSSEHLPWGLWGPSSTQWFPDTNQTDWQHSVYGFRTVESLNEDITREYFSREPRKLRVRDFNPNMTWNYHGEDREGWTGKLVLPQPPPLPPESGSSDALGAEAEENEVQRPFKERLGKALPYREMVSEETFDVTDTMMDESRILLLRRVSVSLDL
ncbi:hypothetical protein F5I97DRAFT_1807942 [Phlebopus sp. FC_14]|nr:hypothetical protein F5I97DRAFT_1807942 [Phlebopus sp. FC_14]